LPPALGKAFLAGIQCPLVKIVVRCSAIEGISHRYHRCGSIFMLEDKGNYRGSSLRMAFRIFRCHRAFKTNEGSLDTSSGNLKVYLASTWMFGDSSFEVEPPT
jgi:hypothetical protein